MLSHYDFRKKANALLAWITPKKYYCPAYNGPAGRKPKERSKSKSLIASTGKWKASHMVAQPGNPIEMRNSTPKQKITRAT
jgi:hypothetical protein